MGNEDPPTFGNGKICYLMIPAVSISDSAAFYESVFGWNIRRKVKTTYLLTTASAK